MTHTHQPAFRQLPQRIHARLSVLAYSIISRRVIIPHTLWLALGAPPALRPHVPLWVSILSRIYGIAAAPGFPRTHRYYMRGQSGSR